MKFLLLALCLASSGCVATKVVLPAKAGDTPGSLSRISLMGDQQVGALDLKNGTLSAYQSEQAQIAANVAAAVTKALVKP